MYWIRILGIFLVIYFCNVLSISLNGKWKGYVPSKGINFTAEVPGGIYTDLERAKLIPENLVGFNDIKNRWVANESVIYMTDIQANDTFMKAPHIVLIFYGLDTFTKIYINDVEVGTTSNMFLRYSFDIKHYLKNGKNELKIVFESSVKVAEKLYNIQLSKYLVPPKCVPQEYNGECHINHIRKMQASYGWDWGPAFPSMGIWKDVELQTIKKVLVSEITTDIVKKNTWQIIVTVFFETFQEKNTNINEPIHILCTLEKKYFNNNIFTNLEVKNNLANATVILNVPLDEVETWWPNGYGKQKLYSLNISVQYETDITEHNIKIGFRTIELVQDPLKKGLSFYFKINGISIFAKGSNWIPSSIFPENLSKPETILNLLNSTKETHMNMLRVWGGGVYESDFFYNIADEYGIMIWQDFMFACNMYPTTTSFLDNVKKEVTQNMRRLKYHPSIVIWAGNNENEVALYGNWYGTSGNKIYKDDYIKLYVDTVKNEASAIDFTRPFVTSSPSNGLYDGDENDPEISPYSNLYGDVHYYNYFRNSWDINQYPVTRFASEYGFQALPSIWTLISASKNFSDLRLNSSFMKHRQHLRMGDNSMTHLINNQFKIPSGNNDSGIRELMDFIYLSQITQAVSVKTESESYRQMKSLFNDIDEGFTMGALYWQLNDVWQAPSWSSIDINGRWKMLHYYVKDFFSPLIITSKITASRDLVIYVVSDLLNTLTNLNIEINIYEWERSEIIHTIQINNITVESNESKLIKQYWMDNLLQSVQCGTLETAKINCFLELVLKDVNNEKIAPLNYVYPHSLKGINLPNDNVIAEIIPYSRQKFVIKLNSQKIALFVWLEVGNIRGHFSENGFHILKGYKKIMLHTFEPVPITDIRKNFMITTLSRIYKNDRISDAQIIIDQLSEFN